MSTITVTLPDELLNRCTRYAQALHISRAAYIRQSLERMNLETERRFRVDRLTQASYKVRDQSMRINGEFDAITAQSKFRKDSDLLLDQLRAIDNQRLIEGPLTRLTTIQLRAITHALKEVMDLG